MDLESWKLNRKECFTSKSFYTELSNPSRRCIPHKGIWIPNIPSKVSIFMWNCFLDKILTLDHLQNRGWNLANRCPLCMIAEESVYSSTALWLKRYDIFFLTQFQTPWVFPKFLHELIFGWWLSGLGSFPQDIWRALSGAICWGLWKERNNRIFEDRYRTHDELVLSIYDTLFKWALVCPSFDDLVWGDIWHERL